MEVFYAVIAFLNVLSAIFAWLLRFNWRKDAIKTRDELIKDKDIQIQNLTQEIKTLQDITPRHIREYFVMVDEQLILYQSRLKTETSELDNQLRLIDNEISKIKTQSPKDTFFIESLEADKKLRNAKIKSLSSELLNIKKHLEITKYLINNPFYEKPFKPSVDDLTKWFFEHYELASNSVPFNASKGGYQYTLGGPYNINLELSTNFPETPVRDILLAVDEVEKQGKEWVKKGQY